MAVLVKGLGDRNVALKKTYAVALGHLVRVAKESSVVKLMETLENRYLEAEDEDSRLACMHTLQAMVRYNPDVVKNHSSHTVPIVFLGKHIFKTPGNFVTSFYILKEKLIFVIYRDDAIDSILGGIVDGYCSRHGSRIENVLE
jgi:hypothetical protein